MAYRLSTMDIITLIIMIAWMVTVAVTYNITALIGAVCFFVLGYCAATRLRLSNNRL